MLKTKNYAKFKYIIGNRQMSTEHVARLRREIETRNLLEVCPIIVNEKFQVIDGQHRIEAAKQLKIEIPYVVVQGMGIEHVVRLNNVQRRWGIRDYIELHVLNGNENYIQLKDFYTKHKISPSNAIVLTSFTSYRTTKTNDFREGRFKIVDLDNAEFLMSMIHRMRPFLATASISGEDAFVVAVKRAHHILEKDDKSIEDLVNTLEQVKTFVIPFKSHIRDYYRVFEDILNYGKPASKYRLF